MGEVTRNSRETATILLYNAGGHRGRNLPSGWDCDLADQKGASDADGQQGHAQLRTPGLLKRAAGANRNFLATPNSPTSAPLASTDLNAQARQVFLAAASLDGAPGRAAAVYTAQE